MTEINIKIVSDTVCPWCYIGLRRLNRSIELFKKTHPAGRTTAFKITWLPYYLDPTAPTPGVPWRERVGSKFGHDRVTEMEGRLTKLGAAEGIAFSFDSKVGNTRDSHRLVELGKTKGEDVQTKVVEALFKGYFEDGGDVTDKEWLVARGVEAGLDKGETREWIVNSDGGGKEVDEEAKRAKGWTNGVPNFTIQNKFVIEGAQDPGEFVGIFAEVVDGKGLSASGAGSGQVC